MEDAVLHGCLPVILQDGVHTPWESVLDTPSYALRVPREKMHTMLETLRAIPPATIARMQAALRAAWPRFSYLSVAAAEYRRRGQSTPPAVARAATHDAVATLMQVLRARAQLRAARGAAPEDAQAAAGGGGDEALRPAASCEAEAHGGDMSPALQSAPVDFEGRKVNGWVI